MKRLLRNFVACSALLPIFGSLLSICIVGCDNSPKVDAETPEHLAERVKMAKRIRFYFDKSNGKYESLSPEDKAAVDKLTNGHTLEAFKNMVAPQGGPSTAGGGMPPPAMSDLPGGK